MNFNTLCKLFKKDKVTANDVVGALFKLVEVVALSCVIIFTLGNMYLHAPNSNYIFDWSIASIATIFGVGAVIFVVIFVIFGVLFYLLLKFMNLLVWITTRISERLKTITLAQCPAYKNKKP